MVYRAALGLVHRPQLHMHFLVAPVKLQRLRILPVGIQIQRQLLNGKVDRLELTEQGVGLELLVDHTHKRKIKPWVKRTPDQGFSGFVLGRIFLLKGDIRICQRCLGRQNSGQASGLIPHRPLVSRFHAAFLLFQNRSGSLPAILCFFCQMGS